MTHHGVYETHCFFPKFWGFMGGFEDFGGGVRGSLGVYGGFWGVLERGCPRALEGFEGFWGFLRVFGGFDGFLGGFDGFLFFSQNFQKI